MTRRRSARLIWVLTLLCSFCPGLARAASGKDDVRAGIYMPLGFGAQLLPDAIGVGGHIGLGIRAFIIGIGAEAHYVYSWGQAPGLITGSAAQTLFLGRLDLYPVRNLKLSGIGGYTNLYPDAGSAGRTSTALAGVRLAYEGHTSAYFSMEPGFTYYQSIGPTQFRALMFTLQFSLWNEALLGSIISGAFSGLTRR